MKTEKLKDQDGVVMRVLILSPDEAAHVIAKYAGFHSYFNACKLARSFRDVPTNGCWSQSGDEFQVVVEEPDDAKANEEKA